MSRRKRCPFCGELLDDGVCPGCRWTPSAMWGCILLLPGGRGWPCRTGSRPADGSRGKTWLVTVFDEHAEQFLHAARFDHYAITVEEVQGAGDDERYLLRFGTPGTGWQG